MTWSTWTDGTGDDLWFDSQNWSPKSVPGVNSNVVIDNNVSRAVDVFSSFGTVNSINIRNIRPSSFGLDFESAGLNSVTTTLLNRYVIYLDHNTGGGTTLSVGGTLNNEGEICIGNGATRPTEVDVGFLRNSNQIDMDGGFGQALLDDESGAGFGTPGLLTGVVYLLHYSAIEFGFGQITSIAAGARLDLEGPSVWIEDANAPGSNSALRGLSDVAGTLQLDGASISTIGNLQTDTNSSLFVAAYQGGSNVPGKLIVNGELTNRGTIDVGFDGRVAVKSLDNEGSISLSHGSAFLSVSGEITNNGEISILAEAERMAGAVGGTGTFDLGNSRLEFDGSVSSGQTVVFQHADYLFLKSASSFAGTVAGFGMNDKIDALSFAFGATSYNFVENAGNTGGTLTLTDGAQVANILMTGSYTNASFALSADTGTGTFVKFV